MAEVAPASLSAQANPPNMQTDLCDTSTRDALTDGLVTIFKPAVEEIDAKVQTVRLSQVELRQQIDSLADDLRKVSETQHVPIDLEPYVKKLNGTRRRVMLVCNILQNSQDRLHKLQNNIAKESARKKAAQSSQTSAK